MSKLLWHTEFQTRVILTGVLGRQQERNRETTRHPEQTGTPMIPHTDIHTSTPEDDDGRDDQGGGEDGAETAAEAPPGPGSAPAHPCSSARRHQVLTNRARIRHDHTPR
jgi:hypothetical protein